MLQDVNGGIMLKRRGFCLDCFASFLNLLTLKLLLTKLPPMAIIFLLSSRLVS